MRFASLLPPSLSLHVAAASLPLCFASLLFAFLLAHTSCHIHIRLFTLLSQSHSTATALCSVLHTLASPFARFALRFAALLFSAFFVTSLFSSHAHSRSLSHTRSSLFASPFFCSLLSSATQHSQLCVLFFVILLFSLCSFFVIRSSHFSPRSPFDWPSHSVWVFSS